MPRLNRPENGGGPGAAKTEIHRGLSGFPPTRKADGSKVQLHPLSAARPACSQAAIPRPFSSSSLPPSLATGRLEASFLPARASACAEALFCLARRQRCAPACTGVAPATKERAACCGPYSGCRVDEDGARSWGSPLATSAMRRRDQANHPLRRKYTNGATTDASMSTSANG